MKNEKTKFSEWLNGLQQESWQLEMLVSGLSIALLFNVFESTGDYFQSVKLWIFVSPTTAILSFAFLLLYCGILFLLLNLSIHLLCRALWIGTIGLRSVSGDIDYEQLGYNKKFISYLNKKIKSFDSYIQRLEDFCSLIFSFSFLILFCLFSAFCFFIVLILLSTLMNAIHGLFYTEEIADSFAFLFLSPLLIAGILYFIDFVTLGFFKRRKKYFSWYLPIYRFMSFITLSFVYRPIYHNLIDNKLGRKFGWWLIPYILFIFLILTTRIYSHKWFPTEEASHITYSKSNYADKRDLKKYNEYPMIESQFTNSDYLNIFIPYIPVEDDSVLVRVCEDFNPGKKTGIASRFIWSITGRNEDINPHLTQKEIADSSFLCLRKMNRVYLDDSLQVDIDYMLKGREKNQGYGLLGILDISDIAPGKHSIRFEKLRFDKPSHSTKPEDEPKWKEQKIIPFWKEK